MTTSTTTNTMTPAMDVDLRSREGALYGAVHSIETKCVQIDTEVAQHAAWVEDAARRATRAVVEGVGASATTSAFTDLAIACAKRDLLNQIRTEVRWAFLQCLDYDTLEDLFDEYVSLYEYAGSGDPYAEAMLRRLNDLRDNQ